MRTCVSPLPSPPLYHSPSRKPLTATKNPSLSLMAYPLYQDTNDPCWTPLLQPVPRVDCLLLQSGLSMSRMTYADMTKIFPPRPYHLILFRSLTFANLCPRNDHGQNHATFRKVLL